MNSFTEKMFSKNDSHWHWIILISFVITLSVFLVSRLQFTSENNRIDIILDEAMSEDIDHASYDYQIEGDKIYQIKDGQKKELFYNVENVASVRIGPDGNTIHFDIPDYYKYYPNCAVLNTKVTKVDTSSPSQAPWDYLKIGSANTIENCGHHYGKSGGYVPSSSYFSYLKESGLDNKLNLVIEDLSLGTSLSYEINVPDWKKVKEAKEYYFVKGLPDANGNLYYFPQNKNLVVDNKLLLGFDAFVIAVDLDAEKLLGSVALVRPDYSLVSVAYYFDTNEDSPLVVAYDAWEAFSTVQAALDLSGKELVTHNLNKLEKLSLGLIANPGYYWEGNALVLDYNDQIAITGQVSEEDLAFFADSNSTEDEKMIRQQEIIEELKKGSNYIDVACTLEPGLVGPLCTAVTAERTYIIRPGQDPVRQD